jgi:hypothetical protein
MAKRKQQGAAWRELGRQSRILQAKKSGKPAIPDKVLKKLAALNLPPNPWVYSVCLDALLLGK